MQGVSNTGDNHNTKSDIFGQENQSMPKKPTVTQISIPALLFAFAVIYGLISLVNHYYFRTYTLDLGFYTNALFDYRNLRWNYSQTISEVPSNMLGGHFEPILFLFAPFSFLFGSYTLLLIQMAALLWGGFCVYRYFKDSNRAVSIGATAFFLGYFSLFAALAFDFHTNVIAAACVPYLFLSVKRGRFAHFAAAFVFMLLCKENISLWLLFICLGLAFEYRKNAVWRKRLLWFAALSLCYFGVLVYGIIPLLSHTGGYAGFLYSSLGRTPHEAIVYMLTHPLGVLKLLFTNTSPYPVYDWDKLEFHILILLTGLPLFLFRPGYLLMLLPLYLQKMLHDQPSLWGVGLHYGVEFAPIMAIGVFEVINGIHKERVKTWAAGLMAVLGLSVTFHTMDSTITFTNKTRIRFYQKAHYTQAYDVKAVHRILREIPADAKVSAQAVFLPHLALRPHIYQFPLVEDAEFIVYSVREGGYPLTATEFHDQIAAYSNSPEWMVWRKHDGFYVLKKRP